MDRKKKMEKLNELKKKIRMRIDKAKEKAKAYIDKAKEKAKKTLDKAKAKLIINQAKEKAKNLIESVKASGAIALNKAKQKGGNQKLSCGIDYLQYFNTEESKIERKYIIETIINEGLANKSPSNIMSTIITKIKKTSDIYDQIYFSKLIKYITEKYKGFKTVEATSVSQTARAVDLGDQLETLFYNLSNDLKEMLDNCGFYIASIIYGLIELCVWQYVKPEIACILEDDLNELVKKYNDNYNNLLEHILGKDILIKVFKNINQCSFKIP
jgi:hypothetical protein